MKKNPDDVVASKADGAASEQAEVSATDSSNANADESAGVGVEDPTDGLPDKMPEDKGAERPDLESVKQEVADDASTPEDSAEESAAGDDAESDSDNDEQELTPEEQVSTLEAELLALKADHKDELLRMQAEMQNQRKRAEAQADRGRKFALEGFAKELLEVKDSLEMGHRGGQAGRS